MQPGPAKKITIYLSENQQYGHVPAARAILDFLRRNGAAGAMMIHGAAGFGAHRRLHGGDTLALSGGLPVKIEWIEAPGKAEELLPRVMEMAGGGLIEIQDTVVRRPSPLGS